MNRTQEALAAALLGARAAPSGAPTAPPGARAPLARVRLALNCALRRALLAAAVLALLGMSGCAYRMGSPRLPGDAGTLAIAVIRNRTFAGELDVRLQHRLRELLLKHPGVELGPIDHSDLILDIELIQFQPVRTRDIASTNFTSVSYLLSGLVSVYDRRRGVYYFRRSQIAASSKLDFDTPTIETPAIRDEGVEDALNAFALQVENLLFLVN